MTSYDLEVANATGFEQIIIEVNGAQLVQSMDFDGAHASVSQIPAQVSVFFWPFKIKPLVRVDGFLLDYWLAGIELFDHKLQFELDVDFFDRYRQRNIQGRIQALTQEQQKSDHFWDKYVGVNNLQADIVAEIRQILNK